MSIVKQTNTTVKVTINRHTKCILIPAFTINDNYSRGQTPKTSRTNHAIASYTFISKEISRKTENESPRERDLIRRTDFRARLLRRRIRFGSCERVSWQPENTYIPRESAWCSLDRKGPQPHPKTRADEATSCLCVRCRAVNVLISRAYASEINFLLRSDEECIVLGCSGFSSGLENFFGSVCVVRAVRG